MSLAGVLVDRGRVLTYTAVMDAGDPGSPADPGDPDALPPVEPTAEVPPTPPAPIKVEGETQMAWETGQWFACRLDSAGAAEARDAAAGRERVAQKPELIYELEDDDGNVVELHAQTRVEIECEELGTHIFELEGEPTLDRKKQDLVCGEASLSRIVDQPRAEAEEA